jgi:L-rhamnose mutarotase
MQSYGMTLMLRDDPEKIEQYKHHHREVWPEVAAKLREIGVQEMRIYLLGRRLFMYMEAVDGFDPAPAFARAMDDPRYREWEELMSSLQERAPEAPPDAWWAPMEEVFDLRWSP